MCLKYQRSSLFVWNVIDEEEKFYRLDPILLKLLNIFLIWEISEVFNLKKPLQHRLMFGFKAWV
jgi:hypothetical protein